jgi:hypothetical protein
MSSLNSMTRRWSRSTFAVVDTIVRDARQIITDRLQGRLRLVGADHA